MLEKFFGDDTTSSLDGQINAVLSKMGEIGVDADEYPTMVGHLERLTAIKKNQKQDAVKADTLAIIAGNLLGILLIIAYEQKHVMTSKGFSQLIKPR